MISFTRHTGLFATILLFITLVVSTLRLYINPYPAELSESGFMPLWWQSILAALLLFAGATVVNRAAVKVGMFGGFSALPVSLFGFISCTILLSPNILSAATASVLTAFGTMFLIRTVQFVNDKESLFTGSLLLGAAAIAYYPAAILALVLVMAVFIFPLSFRQILIAFTGYLLPVLCTSYICWYMGGSFTDVPLNIYHNLFDGTFSINLNLEFNLRTLPLFTAAISAVLLIILLYGIMVGIYHRYTMLVPVRKSIQLTIWMTIITIASLFLPGCGITMLPTIAVPASILAAFSLDRMNTRWANIFYITLVTLILLHLVFY